MADKLELGPITNAKADKLGIRFAGLGDLFVLELMEATEAGDSYENVEDNPFVIKITGNNWYSFKLRKLSKKTTYEV